MTVNVLYHAQLRPLAGVASEQVDLDEGTTVVDLLRRIASIRPRLSKLLLTETNAKQPSLLVFVNNEQREALSHGDEVVLMTPIAGGSA